MMGGSEKLESKKDRDDVGALATWSDVKGLRIKPGQVPGWPKFKRRALLTDQRLD